MIFKKTVFDKPTHFSLLFPFISHFSLCVKNDINIEFLAANKLIVSCFAFGIDSCVSGLAFFPLIRGVKKVFA